MVNDEPSQGVSPQLIYKTEDKREEIHRREISRITQWAECSIVEQ